jgi:hypothetical protein
MSTARNEDRSLCLVSLANIELSLRAYTRRCNAALRTPGAILWVTGRSYEIVALAVVSDC